MEEKSLFDLLLEEDNLIEKERQLEVTRLSKKFNKKFIIAIKSLTDVQINECYESTNEKVDFILESVNIEGKTLKDKSLLDKFKVATFREVVRKIFNTGEITWIYSNILKLNGLSGDTIVELKN